MTKKTHQKIDNLIRSVEREIDMRKRVYPSRILSGRITQGTAEYEIKCMKEVLIILHLVERLNFLEQPETQTKRMILLNTKPELKND